MSRLVLLLACIAGLGGSALADEKTGSRVEKAVCTVCAARQAHDAIEPEKVAAVSQYEGREYYFCSADCQRDFAADPLAYVPAVLPRPAPALTVRSLEGEDLALVSLRGKVVLLDFWATWCKPCHAMLPILDAMHSELGDRGFVVAGISIDAPAEARGLVTKFLAKKPLSYPIYLDVHEPAAWEALHVAAIPAMFLVDRTGEIVAQWAGKIDPVAVRAAVLQTLEPSEP